jgi:ribosomal protein S18 acetylase RimI-like enzyme
MSDLERAAAFEEAVRDAAVERRIETRFGPALFTDSYPDIWTLNVLRVEQPAEASATEIAAEAERVQGEAGLPHRRVLLPIGAGELVAGFEALGWERDHFLFMVRRGGPERPVDTSNVVEVGAEDVRGVRLAIIEEWQPGMDESVVAQIVDSESLITEAANARFFGLLDEGRVVSMAELYSDGRTAQVEEVGTLPSHRERGHARAVVQHAVDEALASGHDFVFLVADADDWPREFYARLGFEEVGSKSAFLLKDASEAGRVPYRATAGL